jgi:hypothetical protein
MVIDGRCCCFGELETGEDDSGKSKSWWVGRQSCCSVSEPESGLMRILSIRAVGMDESVHAEVTELGGEGGEL